MLASKVCTIQASEDLKNIRRPAQAYSRLMQTSKIYAGYKYMQAGFKITGLAVLC